MQKKVVLSFVGEWVLSYAGEEKLPMERFVEALNGMPDYKVLYSSTIDCELCVTKENGTDDEIKKEIFNLIEKIFAIKNSTDVIDYWSITDFSNETVNEEFVDAFDIFDGSLCCDKTTLIVEKINNLVGAEEFKELAMECVKIAPGLIKHNILEAFTHRCYLFAINHGDGMSTYLELFAELIEELKLFKLSNNVKIVEEKLPPERVKEKGHDPFASVYRHLNGRRYDDGKIISIDISEWMNKLTDKAFREFLYFIEDNIGANIVVFRTPFIEKEILESVKNSLGDVLYIRDVSFVPFDFSELTKCAEQALGTRGFSLEEDGWEIFNARINEEKNDGRFYGINTVNKIICEMIYRKELCNAINNVDDTVIKKNEILELSSTYNRNEKTGMDMLEECIGMEKIREQVNEIVAQIEMSQKNKNLGQPCIHMRFIGNPGTGKTTVARVIGKILKEKGILRNGNFFEHLGRDFCGMYIGETAPKTAAMCRDAYGSVLFIDEAYSLYRSEGRSSVDYGREAIDTLIAEMENHRSDLVVIMAGYPDEMENLMKANSGLRSRMPYVIEFPNYTREQLAQIFMLMVNKNFKYGKGFEEAVREYFDTLPDEVVLSKDFSNARFVRNLFERTWCKASLRAQMNKEDATVLIKEDFLVASAEKEFKKIMVKQKRIIGFN